MKYTNHIFLLLISIFCIHSSLSAQEISQESNKIFHYQGQSYKYQDMAHIFSQNEEANNYYIKARRNQKTSKAFGFIALGTATVGIIYGIASEPASCGSNSPFASISCAGSYAFTGTMLLTAAASGLTSLIFRISGKKKRKKSIELFNQDYSIKFLNENPVDVQLVINNGLGIQLKF